MARTFFYVCARRVSWFLVVGLACLAAGVRTCRADTVTIPFGSCGWRYLSGATGTTSELSSLSVDDDSWATGCAPFTSPSGCSPPGTLVPLGRRFVVRKHIVNPGPSAIAHYLVKAQASIATAFNGHEGSSGNLQTGCPANTLEGVFPLATGDNVFLVDFFGYGGPDPGTYVDVQLTLDGVTSVGRSSWGSVKVHYR